MLSKKCFLFKLCSFAYALLSLSCYSTDTEKKIVVSITSYNNADWYQKNLDSVFNQNYSNFRIIYIDDASPDGTAELVKEYIKQKNMENKVLLIAHKDWKSQSANHYIAGHLCDDQEIIVTLDGDDWLEPDALATINDAYQDPNVWLTYGTPGFYPENPSTQFRAIPEDIINENSFREDHGKPEALGYWNWWHPRTYYGWLFKQLKLEDLLIESSFAPSAPSPDSAIMYPLLEMAGHHAVYIPKVLYIWNMKNPISQWVISGGKQLAVNSLVRSWEQYKPLHQPQVSPKARSANKSADLIIFHRNNPYGCYNFIKSLKKHMSGINRIYVIYEAVSQHSQSTYYNLEKLAPVVKTFHVSAEQSVDAIFKTILPKLNNYIIFSDAQRLVSKPISLNHTIQQLEKTAALGAYLNVSISDPVLPKHEALEDNTYAWQFRDSSGVWGSPFNFYLALYRKEDILAHLNNIIAPSLQIFHSKWLSLNTEQNIKRKVGLFFK